MTIASTITATLSRHARETPDRPAVICETHAASWKDLDQVVNRLAAYLNEVVPVGKNVHPEEIERVLERHPAVIAAGVLGVIDEGRASGYWRCSDLTRMRA
jgi:acyl-CoA synthetase (AMP-forming)/AMP-acid ligase II